MELIELKDYAIDKLIRQNSELNLRIIELEYLNNKMSQQLKDLESNLENFITEEEENND